MNDPALAPYTDMHYRGFDLDYTDVNRAKEFLAKLKEMDANGKMPRFTLIRLGNDHTSGTTPGKIAPLSSFADNDYALGLIIEGLSKSQFWAKTAVFITEDDAQNGPDHVEFAPVRRIGDLALYAPRRDRQHVLQPNFNDANHGADSGPSSDDALRCGLAPDGLGVCRYSQHGAVCRRCATHFSTTRNPARSQTAERSERMDFSEADKIDDDELNDVLWLAIRGTDPPPPMRSYFSMRP